MQPTSEVLRQAPRRRALARDESGATVVEMAVVFGLFLLFTFGIIEFSWALAEWNEVRSIAGECARNASVGDPPAGCSSAVLAVGASCEISDVVALPTGQRATVTVSKDYDGITGWFPLSMDLSATHEFFIEAGAPAGAGPC